MARYCGRFYAMRCFNFAAAATAGNSNRLMGSVMDERYSVAFAWLSDPEHLGEHCIFRGSTGTTGKHSCADQQCTPMLLAW
jgi:hypothetical protein